MPRCLLPAGPFALPDCPPPPLAPARLRVGVVGAGRVGAVLGAALAAAGHDVVAAAGVSAASAERAARLLPGVPLLPADEVVAASDLVVLAVPDDTLAGPGRRAGRDRRLARRASSPSTPPARTASRCSRPPSRPASCRSRCTPR